MTTAELCEYLIELVRVHLIAISWDHSVGKDATAAGSCNLIVRVAAELKRRQDPPVTALEAFVTAVEPADPRKKGCIGKGTRLGCVDPDYVCGFKACPNYGLDS